MDSLTCPSNSTRLAWPLKLNEARMASFQLPVQASVLVGQHLTPARSDLPFVAVVVVDGSWSCWRRSCRRPARR